jgi:hypothetical protein
VKDEFDRIAGLIGSNLREYGFELQAYSWSELVWSYQRPSKHFAVTIQRKGARNDPTHMTPARGNWDDYEQLAVIAYADKKRLMNWNIERSELEPNDPHFSERQVRYVIDEITKLFKKYMSADERSHAESTLPPFNLFYRDTLG